MYVQHPLAAFGAERAVQQNNIWNRSKTIVHFDQKYIFKKKNPDPPNHQPEPPHKVNLMNGI